MQKWRIAHLADIHIQSRRREEYQNVFSKLYESLRNCNPDLIVIAGDVFDNKMHATANNLKDVTDFLINMSDIAPVILIAGNHDTNCITPGALDLLTPLISEHQYLQPPRLTYWRHSGVYYAHNIQWTVIATDGVPPALPASAPTSQPTSQPAITLFHTEINGALLPNGQPLQEFAISPGDLTGDMNMGGHIHLRQMIGDRAAYCGSLIQQNIGESHLNHGYLIWEFNPETIKSVPPTIHEINIENSQGFLRVIIDEYGEDITEHPIPQTPL